MVYAREHAAYKRSAAKIAHTIANLSKWWGDKTLTDVTARNCRAFAATRPKVAARRDLETLRASIMYWHREYGPLPSVPIVTLPEKPAGRERWLTRSEVARLLWAARRQTHLRRFILLALYTGSRSGAILQARWSWVDLETGVMRRRAPGTTETNKRTPPVRLKGRILTHVRRWAGLDGMPEGPIVCYAGQAVIKLRRSWQTAVEASGLQGQVTPHTLRHTRATWLMREGASIWDAAGQLGMSAVVLERVYGHHAPNYQDSRR